MRTFRAGLIALFLAGLALAAPGTPSEAADLVLRAVRENPAALAELARAADPDPWLVADELCVRGEHDAAAEFAKAAPRADLEALPRYVETRRTVKADATVRAALDAAERDPAGAIPLLEKARAAGDLFERTRVAEALGYAYEDAGRAAESTEAFGDAGDRAVELGWLARAVFPLVRAGQGALRAADYDGAVARWTQLQELQDKRGEAAFAATTMHNVGSVLAQAGDYDRALATLTKASERLRALGLTDALPGALANLGLVQARRGGFRKACLVYEEAIGLAAPAPKAWILLLLADAKKNLGDDEAARRALEQALSIYEGLGDALGVAGARHSLGVLALARDPAKAVQFLGDARPAIEKSGTPQQLAGCITNMGKAQSRLGRHPEAIALHRQALEIARRLGDPWLVGAILNNLGDADVAAGAFEDALTPYAEAVEIGERIGSADLVVEGELGRTKAELGRKRFAPAAEAARRGIDVLARILRGLADRQGATARARHAELYRVAALAAVELGDPAVLFGFLESGRAGALLESLEDGEAVRSAAIPQAMRDAEAAARLAESKAEALHRRAVNQADLKEAKARRAAWRTAVAATERIVETIQAQAKDAADFLYPRQASLADARAGLADGDALVLYACLDERAAALVVTRTSARIVSLDPAACRPVADRDALRALLVTPLGLDASVRRVLVSPDGPLFFVPFASVLEGRDVAYVPSATTARLLAARAADAGTGVLAVGDPDYAGRPLDPLPGTRAEAKGVGDVVLLGPEATEAHLRKALADGKRLRALHLACHGLIDAADPLQSSLALTAADSDDGRLTALEVLSMRVPADLAVLSACETAQGKVYRGEGVVGLTRAFLFAGVPRVVVSLWKTDDASTEALMRKFYELWNPKDGTKGVPAAMALRRAQEFVASHEKWKDPRFWAAWQLWGVP